MILFSTFDCQWFITWDLVIYGPWADPGGGGSLGSSEPPSAGLPTEKKQYKIATN